VRRVVVTGAAGLLGGYVADAFESVADTVGLDVRPAASGREHVVASILDLDAVITAFRGADSVMHVAAAANITAGSHREIVERNALGTWTVLEAALRAGVRRVVLCSTDSVLGNTVWRDHVWCPQQAPVPEDHPLRPADPYGLSKLMAEEAGRSYALRGLEVLALRPVFILFPGMMGEVRARHADPDAYSGPCAGGHVAAGGGPFWHHVDPRDVAEAFRLADAVPWTGFDAFWLSAASTLHAQPTLDRMAEVFGRLPDRIDRSVYDAAPFAPIFDIRRAAQKLGWTPRFDHRAAVVDRSPALARE